ncbi:hypothetical protein WJX74_008103 [Apatococcus lobatus]|uniref:Uncharacterized protein n=1 Tax=Apatococcus lobatus TaxID=904363 RepID=A0AAW1QJQ0_9CHLO
MITGNMDRGVSCPGKISVRQHREIERMAPHCRATHSKSQADLEECMASSDCRACTRSSGYLCVSQY